MNNNFDYQQNLFQKDVSKDDCLLLNDYSFNPMHQDMWAENMNDNKDELVTNPVACDLRDVIVYYQSQPDLLRLILLSKVEEDKRRTEEAKLRAKELDVLLFEQQDQHFANDTTLFDTNLIQHSQFDERRPSAIDLLLEDIQPDRRDSALGSSFDGSSNSNDELDEHAFSPTCSNTPSAAATAAILSMSFSPQSMASVTNQNSGSHPLSPPFTFGQEQPITSQMKLEQRPSGEIRRYENVIPPKTRRRREMQAISKIVETRENPYNDGFFWKNNGNTVQKKTGNKSIYYKCSNSAKGCPVNKTVTAKENGEYLIKYRGGHLLDCGKVQRIVDV